MIHIKTMKKGRRFRHTFKMKKGIIDVIEFCLILGMVLGRHLSFGGWFDYVLYAGLAFSFLINAHNISQWNKKNKLQESSK